MPDRSPFPGMDPWLESHWGDVHHDIISRLADQIAAGLPPDLFVTVQVRVYMLNLDGPVTEGLIEIRRLSDGRPLVTAVGVLSPSNKSWTQGREECLRKRDDYHQAGVNVMEFDLLGGGTHLLDVPLARRRAEWAMPYKVAVGRGGAAGRSVEYYPLPLRQRLPRIRVPLRPGDPDVVAGLQQPIDHVYKRGRYDVPTDYAQPPRPPLSADDAAWAAECVAAALR